MLCSKIRGHHLAWLCLGLYVAGSAVYSASPHWASAEQDRKNQSLQVGDSNRLHLKVSENNCTSCHRTEHALTHPVDVRPSMPVPSHLPLKAGQMTCMTCHEMDDPQLHHLNVTQGSGLLRGAQRGQRFCTQCHEDSPGNQHIAHGIALGKAHLAWSGKSRFGFSSSLAGGLDTESRDCMSCHDGTLAGDLGNSHPVGVEYDDRRRNLKQTGKRSLTPLHRLDSRVRLFSGTVGCGSCHSPYAGEDKLLIMKNTRSQLCISCHDHRR